MTKRGRESLNGTRRNAVAEAFDAALDLLTEGKEEALAKARRGWDGALTDGMRLYVPAESGEGA